MAARAQLEQMRRRALPGGFTVPGMAGNEDLDPPQASPTQTGQYL